MVVRCARRAVAEGPVNGSRDRTAARACGARKLRSSARRRRGREPRQAVLQRRRRRRRRGAEALALRARRRGADLCAPRFAAVLEHRAPSALAPARPEAARERQKKEASRPFSPYVFCTEGLAGRQRLPRRSRGLTISATSSPTSSSSSQLLTEEMLTERGQVLSFHYRNRAPTSWWSTSPGGAAEGSPKGRPRRLRRAGRGGYGREHGARRGPLLGPPSGTRRAAPREPKRVWAAPAFEESQGTTRGIREGWGIRDGRTVPGSCQSGWPTGWMCASTQRRSFSREKPPLARDRISVSCSSTGAEMLKPFRSRNVSMAACPTRLLPSTNG